MATENENENDYYEEPTASHGEFIPNSFGDSIAAGIPEQEAKKQADPNVKVEHGYVINMPLCNLKGRRILLDEHEMPQITECYIVLYEHFVIYKAVAKMEMYDESLEHWYPYRCNYRWTRMRKDITDVTMSYDNEEKLYLVQIEFAGQIQTWYYEKGTNAKKFHDILQNYFVTRDQTL